jgi:hypothetical protein
MVATLAAGSAVLLFGVALLGSMFGAASIATGASLAGLLALSVAILAHVSDPTRR